ncbi:MAG: dTMP kinase [Planctomycetota bacterium]|nr:dTMP kinase [Planctomycetota bacterium]
MVQSTVSSLRSRFIVLDGPEGSGKSTQVRLLAGTLQEQGLAPLIVRDPGATRIGEQIRAILLDPAHTEMSMRCEMLLYMAARAQMMGQTIVPALGAGQTVICDRFVSSTLAYQLGGDGLTAEEIRAIGAIAIKSGWPDLTIILDIPIAQSFARVQRAKDRIEQRPAEYHEQVRRNYLAQAAGDPLRYRVINADRPVEQVHTEIWSAIRNVFG